MTLPTQDHKWLLENGIIWDKSAYVPRREFEEALEWAIFYENESHKHLLRAEHMHRLLVWCFLAFLAVAAAFVASSALLVGRGILSHTAAFTPGSIASPLRPTARLSFQEVTRDGRQ